MVIFFNVEEAKQHLLEKGYVYTLRMKRRTGRDTARSGSYYRFEDLGEVEVELVKKISSPEELKPYVHASGFKTVEEWLKHAEEGADHLYKVTLIKSSNDNRWKVMVNETRCPYCGKLIPAFEFAEHHATCEERLKHFGKVFRGEVLDSWIEAARVKPLTEFMEKEEKKEKEEYLEPEPWIVVWKSPAGNYWNEYPYWYKSEEAARRRAEKLKKEFKEKYDLDVEVRVIKLSELFELGR